MKRCPVCEIVKPLSQFPPRRDRFSGVMSRCHECDAAKSRAYYERNRERKAAYYQENAARVRARNEVDRLQAIEIYGGACSQCGDMGQLEFDHVDWDGPEHRAVEQAAVMVRRIVREGQPIEDRRLQVLCRPCHRARRIVPRDGHGRFAPVQ